MGYIDLYTQKNERSGEGADEKKEKNVQIAFVGDNYMQVFLTKLFNICSTQHSCSFFKAKTVQCPLL